MMLKSLLLVLLVSISTVHCHKKHKIHPKIVNGVPTTTDDFPWIVSFFIGYVSNSGDYEPILFHQCGGSVIRNTHPAVILTAAHCLEPMNADINYYETIYDTVTVMVDLSRDDIEQYKNKEVYVRYRVYDWIYHQEYSTSSFANDIAVMSIYSELKETGSSHPINLGTTLDIDNDDQVRVIGYGVDTEDGDYTNTIEYLDLLYKNQSSCLDYLNYYFWKNSTGVGYKQIDWAGLTQSDFDDMKSSSWEYKNYLTTGSLCAVNFTGDSCQGDSGGPLIQGTSSTSDQIGIVSWGYGCARGIPGVYTDVTHYTSWIEGARDCLVIDQNTSDATTNASCTSFKNEYGEDYGYNTNKLECVGCNGQVIEITSDSIKNVIKDNWELILGVCVGLLLVVILLSMCVCCGRKSSGSKRRQSELNGYLMV